jgi:YidC/Oxa1 family membrane protein insertase
MQFIRHLLSMAAFFQLPRAQRRVVFYSEGRPYWVHLEAVLREFLESIDVPVCYISSSEDDPGLRFDHCNLKTFKVDDGGVRNWLFEGLDADVVVMTMPDLHSYQIKRSRHRVHYVYVQHSLISLHMAYRKAAFDHFDTVFCAGPHHVKEIRAMEAKYNLPAKNLFEHGYGRLDAILEEAGRRGPRSREEAAPPHVLIAPSWGHETIIERIGGDVVRTLLSDGFKVTLRPHPLTIRFARAEIDQIVRLHGSEPMFALEDKVDSQDSLHQSDLMISDWSGAALDYSFGQRKPVLFVDVPRKVNNVDYEEIGIEPFEVWIRDKIGRRISLDEIGLIGEYARDLLAAPPVAAGDIEAIRESNVFNVTASGVAGAREIRRLLA